MGSANCKEYTTTTKNGKVGEDQTGTTGTYQSNCEANMADYTEPVTVCNAKDLQENEMKQLDFIGDTKILLIKQNGLFSAIGNKCSHYGAPLHTGTLGNGRIRCPWHGACFDITTGDIEDFPGLDSIPCYKVDVALDGQVKVSAKRSDIEKAKRLKDMAKRSEENDKCFVVIGGGPAGGVCVETLRQEGFTGRIVLICREQDLPYDRIKINKQMDIEIEKIQFRSAEFYEEHSIEVLRGVAATRLDAENKMIHCSNGYSIKYDKTFIATGSRAVKPPIKGAELKNVFTIRENADVKAIVKLINPEVNAVCLGASFIAMESAAYLAKKVKSITVVARDNFPFKASLGDEIGERVLELYKEHGVHMIMNSGIEEVIGDSDGSVAEVKLKDGSILPCSLLIMGTGSRFYTDFLKDSPIQLNKDGSIDTDMHLMSNVPGIFVGGDIAHAPVFSNSNQRTTIGHYQLAQYHGRIAAINMVGNVTELRAVPFFFTMIFGKGIRYSGHGAYTDVYIDGDLANLKFAAYYLDGNQNVVAVASCGRDPIVAQFAELQYQGKRLHRSDILGKENTTEWTKMLKEHGKENLKCAC